MNSKTIEFSNSVFKCKLRNKSGNTVYIDTSEKSDNSIALLKNARTELSFNGISSINLYSEGEINVDVTPVIILKAVTNIELTNTVQTIDFGGTANNITVQVLNGDHTSFCINGAYDADNAIFVVAGSAIEIDAISAKIISLKSDGTSKIQILAGR